ncbi:MAG: calcineurin-like phosphoesterase family protein [Candidatus Sumerlaeia bacterium]|nr:calcineurin-like phosphoesterase family protein [Candidatus Sumerlaeia bacterium]
MTYIFPRIPLQCALLIAMLLMIPAASLANDVATGVVFIDFNENGLRDDGEEGVPGVAVSNGRDVVITDSEGRYEIPVTDDTIIFITRPAGYAVPLSEHNIPQFYYIHKPEGSPDLYFPGIPPTGPLPESVDFALIPVDQNPNFDVIVFADPQPESYDELYHMQAKFLSELIGSDASFGIVLGDIMFDHLNMFPDYLRIMGTVEVPFYHVVGNHDLNRDAPDNALSTETYKRYFGPVDYSWQYGQVHFVTLNNIKWHGRERGGYHTGLDEHQLEWLRNDISAAGSDRLVVVNIHGPAYIPGGRRMPGLDEMMEILHEVPGVLILSGHTHVTRIHELGPDDGWMGEGTFRELNAVTISGSWWSGPRDYMGVPIGLQSDGVPPGYTIIGFNETDYTFRYKGGGLPADHQMRIHPPGQHWSGDSPYNTLLANIYYGHPQATVEYRLNGGEWQAMEFAPQRDPLAQVLLDGPLNHSKPIVGSNVAHHMWQATVTAPLPRFRPNRWEVRAINPDGTVLEGALSHTP